MKRSFVILLGLLVLNSPAQTSRIAPELCELLASPTRGPRAFARVFQGIAAPLNWCIIPRETRATLMNEGLISHLDPQTAQDLIGVTNEQNRCRFMNCRPTLLPTTRGSLNNRKCRLLNLITTNRISLFKREWPYYLMDKDYDQTRQLMVDFCHTAHSPKTSDIKTLEEVSGFKVITVTPKDQQRLVLGPKMYVEPAYEYARRQFFKTNQLSRKTLLDRALLRFWTWETIVLAHMVDWRRGHFETDQRVSKIVEQELARKFTDLSSTRSSIMQPLIDHIDRIIAGEQLPPYQVALDQGTFPQDYETKGRPDLLPQGYEDEAQHRQGGLGTFFETFEVR